MNAQQLRATSQDSQKSQLPFNVQGPVSRRRGRSVTVGRNVVPHGLRSFAAIGFAAVLFLGPGLGLAWSQSGSNPTSVPLRKCRGNRKMFAIIDRGNGPERFTTNSAFHDPGTTPTITVAGCRFAREDHVRVCKEVIYLTIPLSSPQVTGIFTCPPASAGYRDSSTGQHLYWGTLADCTIEVRRNRHGKLKGLFSATLMSVSAAQGTVIVTGCFNSKAQSTPPD